MKSASPFVKPSSAPCVSCRASPADAGIANSSPSRTNASRVPSALSRGVIAPSAPPIATGSPSPTVSRGPSPPGSRIVRSAAFEAKR